MIPSDACVSQSRAMKACHGYTGEKRQRVRAAASHVFQEPSYRVFLPRASLLWLLLSLYDSYFASRPLKPRDYICMVSHPSVMGQPCLLSAQILVSCTLQQGRLCLGGVPIPSALRAAIHTLLTLVCCQDDLSIWHLSSPVTFCVYVRAHTHTFLIKSLYRFFCLFCLNSR